MENKEVVEEMYNSDEEQVEKRQKLMKESLLGMLANEDCHVYSIKSSAHEYDNHLEYCVMIHKMYPKEEKED